MAVAVGYSAQSVPAAWQIGSRKRSRLNSLPDPPFAREIITRASSDRGCPPDLLQYPSGTPDRRGSSGPWVGQRPDRTRR